MLSLLKIAHSRRRRDQNASGSPEPIAEEVEKDPVSSKDVSDNEDDSILKEGDPATIRDPDLNPGGLSFDEGTSARSVLLSHLALTTVEQIRPEEWVDTLAYSAARS